MEPIGGSLDSVVQGLPPVGITHPARAPRRSVCMASSRPGVDAARLPGVDLGPVHGTCVIAMIESIKKTVRSQVSRATR